MALYQRLCHPLTLMVRVWKTKTLQKRSPRIILFSIRDSSTSILGNRTFKTVKANSPVNNNNLLPTIHSNSTSCPSIVPFQSPSPVPFQTKPSTSQTLLLPTNSISTPPSLSLPTISPVQPILSYLTATPSSLSVLSFLVPTSSSTPTKPPAPLPTVYAPLPPDYPPTPKWSQSTVYILLASLSSQSTVTAVQTTTSIF